MNNIKQSIEIMDCTKSANKKMTSSDAYDKELFGKAIDDALEALVKLNPMKIDRIGNKCPICKCYLASKPVGDHYCFNCGQAIDWED